MWSLESEISGNLYMGIMVSEQCCWRIDTVSLMVISVFKIITLPSKHYEILAQWHSVTPHTPGLWHSNNFMYLDISCMWLLLTQKQVFQYHYARIFGGQNHSVQDVKKDDTCKTAHLIVSQFTHTTTHQIITRILMLTSVQRNVKIQDLRLPC